MDDKIRVEDFDELSPLVKAYELQPGKFYLLIVEGKGFSYEAAHKMLEKVREYHPDINLFIQVVAKDQKVKVAEKKQEHDTSISS